MIPEEKKTQIIKTRAQWESGLCYRLEILEKGGTALYPMPAFKHWFREIEGAAQPCCLAVDACGEIYFIDKESYQLYRYTPGTRYLEQIPDIGGHGSDPGTFKNPKRIIINTSILWVLDAGNKRVQAFSKEDSQVKYKYIIDSLKEPVDIAADKENHLFLLDKKGSKTTKIFAYDINGNIISDFVDRTHLQDPVGLAVGAANNLYIIDRFSPGIHTFTNQGKYLRLVGDFSRISEDFKPSLITIDSNGSIYLVDSNTGGIHRLDPDGSYIEAISIPDFSGTIQGFASDSRGNLFAAASQGIAFFDTQQIFTKEKGTYYSKTLDSGIQECRWHRLELNVDLPPKTTMEIYYYASDDDDLKEKIEDCLSHDEKSTQEKVECVEDIISWNGPEKNTEDMLFRQGAGRYLWLKIELSTFEKTVRPTVTRMRIDYPRLSYLRYLPAEYQEDPASKEFLERFLSIFQTLQDGLEEEIEKVPAKLDVKKTPSEFLSWLSTWLGAIYDETWGEERWRTFLSRAVELYKKKGTKNGLEEILEIYTGQKPCIIEKIHVTRESENTVNLGLNDHEEEPGEDVRLFAPPADTFTEIGESSKETKEPLLLWDVLYGESQSCFTVLLKTEALTGSSLDTIRRIIENWKPAHTCHCVAVLIPWFYLDMHTYLGVNTKLTRPEFILDVFSLIGRDTMLSDGEDAGFNIKNQKEV